MNINHKNPKTMALKKKRPVRVIIPRNADKAFALANRVLRKHSEDGDASPLKVLQDHNWTDSAPLLERAEKLQDSVKQMERDLERKYKERDLALAPVMATLRASRDILLSVHASNPRRLGEWGYEVNDSPQRKAGEE
jgi:hypothetical protein